MDFLGGRAKRREGGVSFLSFSSRSSEGTRAAPHRLMPDDLAPQVSRQGARKVRGSLKREGNPLTRVALLYWTRSLVCTTDSPLVEQISRGNVSGDHFGGLRFDRIAVHVGIGSR